MNRRRAGALLLLLGSAGMGPAAWAQKACRVDASPPLVFGVYNPMLQADLVAQTEIAISCIGKGVHLARIELARDPASRDGAHLMRYGTAALRYGLYQDGALSVAWGDGTGGTHARTVAVLPGHSRVLPVHARIWARQNVPPGRYTDTVTVRVDW